MDCLNDFMNEENKIDYIKFFYSAGTNFSQAEYYLNGVQTYEGTASKSLIEVIKLTEDDKYNESRLNAEEYFENQ